MVHHINTIPSPPVTCRPRRLSPDRLAIAKAEFDTMLKDGTARRSDSTWSSALHLIPKKDSGWRPCGDYRVLSARTIPDRYPVRHIHDYAHHLAGCTIFSSIYLARAYHQIPGHSDDVQETAITTPFGFFEFLFMSFGLRNAAQTFQLIMDEIFEGDSISVSPTSTTYRCTDAHHKSTTNTSGPFSNSYRPAGSCSTPANVSFVPQKLHFSATGSRTRARSRCQTELVTSRLVRRPYNPQSSEVLEDAELLPPFPASHRSHASISTHPPRRHTYQRLTARHLDRTPQTGHQRM